MCQSKAAGGARCSIHHHGTRAAVQTTVAKTSIEATAVEATFKSLNKEGKNLEAPSDAEFQAYLEKERFVTEIDPSLSERDKKMILKKIEQAKTENTPSGGTFHAWKNLMGESMRRYGRKIRMGVAALGLSGLVVMTSGCVQGINEPGETPGGTPSSSPTASSLVYGDVIENGSVTDEYGSYIKTTISPDDESYKTLVGDVDPALYTNGYTEADVLSAQQFVATFAASESTDSTAVDGNGWEAWRANVGPQYVSGPFAQDLLNPAANGTDDRAGIIFNNPNNSTPLMIRDGKPRLTSNVITIDSIKNVDYEGAHYIKVNGSASTSYRVSDADGLAWAMQRNNLTQEEVISQVPTLNDGKENTFLNTFNFGYTLEKKADGSWGIVGSSTKYSGNLIG